MSDLLEVYPKSNTKIIHETLNRIGIANRELKQLFPSCYMVLLDNKYYLAHFKQLFAIIRDNSYDNMSDEDLKRRNAIAFCLKKWNLIDVDDSMISNKSEKIFVLPYSDKGNWTITHKFNMNNLYAMRSQ